MSTKRDNERQRKKHVSLDVIHTHGDLSTQTTTKQYTCTSCKAKFYYKFIKCPICETLYCSNEVNKNEASK